jgi:hypothetical protein
MSAPLRDAKGCLTPAGFQALTSAPIGHAPAELATHVAGCARCQERMLSGAQGPGPVAPRKPVERPPIWRALVVVVGFLLLALFAILSMRRFM